jgi:hypothetical protein
MDIGQTNIMHTAISETLRIQDIHTQPFFYTVLAASLMGWVFGMTRGFHGTRDWLARYWSTPPPWLTFILDLLIFGVVGAYMGTGLFDPSSFQAAVTAGFMWPIALQALISKKRPTARSSSVQRSKKTKPEMEIVRGAKVGAGKVSPAVTARSAPVAELEPTSEPVAVTEFEPARSTEFARRRATARIRAPVWGAFLLVGILVFIAIVILVTNHSIPTNIKVIFAPGWILLRWIGIIETFALLILLILDLLDDGIPGHRLLVFTAALFLTLPLIVGLEVFGLFDGKFGTFWSWQGVVLSLCLFTLLYRSLHKKYSISFAAVIAVNVVIILALWTWFA